MTACPTFLDETICMTELNEDEKKLFGFYSKLGTPTEVLPASTYIEMQNKAVMPDLGLVVDRIDDLMHLLTHVEKGAIASYFDGKPFLELPHPTEVLSVLARALLFGRTTLTAKTLKALPRDSALAYLRVIEAYRYAQAAIKILSKYTPTVLADMEEEPTSSGEDSDGGEDEGKVVVATGARKRRAPAAATQNKSKRLKSPQAFVSAWCKANTLMGWSAACLRDLADQGDVELPAAMREELRAFFEDKFLASWMELQCVVPDLDEDSADGMKVEEDMKQEFKDVSSCSAFPVEPMPQTTAFLTSHAIPEATRRLGEAFRMIQELPGLWQKSFPQQKEDSEALKISQDDIKSPTRIAKLVLQASKNETKKTVA